MHRFSAEAIAQKLSSIDLPGREYQTYIVGSGVTAKGTKKLAKMLACMTIGDLDALLHLKNIDPAKVTELLKDIQDLAKALVIFSFPNQKFEINIMLNDEIILLSVRDVK